MVVAVYPYPRYTTGTVYCRHPFGTDFWKTDIIDTGLVVITARCDTWCGMVVHPVTWWYPGYGVGAGTCMYW